MGWNRRHVSWSEEITEAGAKHHGGAQEDPRGPAARVPETPDRLGAGGSGVAESFGALGLATFLCCNILLSHYFRVKSGPFQQGFGVPVFPGVAGLDFLQVYSWDESLLAGDRFSSDYTPFVLVAQLPFTLLPPRLAYILFSLVLVFSLLGSVSACLAERGLFRRRDWALGSLLVASLFYHTYPTLFAIERGNSDLIAAVGAAVGLLMLSRHRPVAALAGLTLAAQYKVYPIILAIMLPLRKAWPWLPLFVVLNGALLLILGPTGLEWFARSLAHVLRNPRTPTVNHSLASFAVQLAKGGYLTDAWRDPAVRIASGVLVAILAVAWLRLARRAGRLGRASLRADGRRGPFTVVEIGVIGMAFQLMSLIPTTSHDYQLVVQIVPFLLLLTRPKAEFPLPGWLVRVVIIGIAVSMAYLFAYPLKLIKTPGLLVAYVAYGVLAFARVDRLPAHAVPGSGPGGSPVEPELGP